MILRGVSDTQIGVPYTPDVKVRPEHCAEAPEAKSPISKMRNDRRIIHYSRNGSLRGIEPRRKWIRI
ncbi:hypothetical protein AGR6A_Lc150035 [Agrobacterium sp. NCPPB 925]|nr:hypothetical protein AGR6A_Lc150035 [Agrobacterium sp. NCPPB 925]